jgi:S-adenosylmethionine-dependent methyltransferase
MLDDIRDIAEFYNSNPNGEEERLTAHQLEFDLTFRYLQKYLPSQGNILEVGAATGRYTVELARQGYQVTAVDLSAALLDRCRQRLITAGVDSQVRLVVADARQLDAVTERDFDAVLLMGPLYHLIEAADRTLALQEAVDRLREGGVLISAFLSRYGVLGDFIKRIPHWIEDQEHVRSFMTHGRRPDSAPRGGFRAYFANVTELPPLHEALGLETLVVAAAEPGISADDESYNRLSPTQRQLWLDLLYEVSTEPSIVGASRHLLYIGQKKPSSVSQTQVV